MDTRIVVLKIFHDYLGTFFVICSYFLPIFAPIFHNIVIIYNARNWSNDKTESQKEKKACFNAHTEGKWNLAVQCIVTKQNKMWSLKSLVMLSVRLERVYTQHNISDRQAMFWCSVMILEMASLDTLFLCSAGQQTWLCS